MLQLCEEFNNGDVFIDGATEYGNYRETMMSTYECRPFIKDFCEAAKIPRNGKQAVKEMREKLTDTIHRVNRDYPKQCSFVINSDGVPSLKKPKSKPNHYVQKILKEIQKRMPERNLLDALCLSHSNTGWAHCLSPLSGSDAKLADHIAANIVTTFCYGTALGPAETERHVKSNINERTMAGVNKSHVTLKKLNRAMAKIIDYYKGFPLIMS